ncbi:MAG: hypothetical protein Q4E57_10315 [Eubacteriales bacterium]|nr:hypothetical protein [Eubacteriales bacterium]
MSEKNVQSYMPYTRGVYGGEKSDTAERSKEYRDRMKQAAENQVGRQHLDETDEIQMKEVSPDMGKVIDFDGTKKSKAPEMSPLAMGESYRMPSVLKLRFELCSPVIYDGYKGLDMESEEEAEFLKLAKAEKGITRDVLVHGEMNLHAIHYMIQKLFGWQNSHLHHFELSEDQFNTVTNDQSWGEYLKFCGSIFRFPGSKLSDEFWDDDYSEGHSFNTWLRSKYNRGSRALSVEESFLRTRENIEEFKENWTKELKLSDQTKLMDIGMTFESGFNALIESIKVRGLFKNALPQMSELNDKLWKSMQEIMINSCDAEYEDLFEAITDLYDTVMNDMDDLLELRENISNIEEAIRYGRTKDVKKFYKMEPELVIHEQKKIVKRIEKDVEPFLGNGNPVIIPFVSELFYNYDYGDDWYVRITCLDAYTANENYDSNYVQRHIDENNVFVEDRKIAAKDLQYRNLAGEQVDPELREKLQRVYLEWKPVCIDADGLNVMDDVGGLGGFQNFLQVINSKDPDDAEEKESSRTWAKGMGWTGRKLKPENIL